MKPAKDIHELIKRMQVEPSADVDKQVHDRITKALEEWDKSKGISWRDRESRIGRIIMKNRIARIAAAAAIIVACFTGLIFWKGTGADVALADVLTRIEQVTGYSYQMSSTMTRKEVTSRWTSTILVSKEHGIKMTVTKADPNSVQNQSPRYCHSVGDEAYLLPQQKSLVFVNHKEKEYNRFVYDGPKLEFYKEEYNEPHIIIKQILSCEHTTMGQSIVDGITVEGFQTTDIAYEGGFFGQAELEGEHQNVDVKLWVDVNTFLPVRLEEDIITKKGLHIREASYDFRWNVVVAPGDLEPNIQEDYRAPAGDIIIPAFDEANAIKGFRLFADAVGKYPAGLEGRATKVLVEEYKRHTSFDPNSYEDMSDAERTKETSEWISLGLPSIFYKTLLDENKDPAYYGETVGPYDVDKVLLRWKLDNDRYRVIFGDLSTKTVTLEELSKLEEP